MHAVEIKKSESDIVHIILRQLPERYDVVKRMILADPQLTRQRLENTIRSAYSQRKAHEIAKQWPAMCASAEPPYPHALVVGRGFRNGGGAGGGGMPRQQQQLQQHWSRGGDMLRQQQQLQQHWPRDGGMPRQQQPQQHWPRDGGMPRQQQQQQHWSRGGGIPRQQQQQQQWSRGGGIPHQHQRSSQSFPPAWQARQQQPLQQSSRGIPTIGGDGEDGSSPLSETFFGGDGGAVEEWLQSKNVEMPIFSLLEGPQQSAPTVVALAGAAPAAEAMTGTRAFPDKSSKGVAEAPTSSAGAASAAVLAAAAPAVEAMTGTRIFPDMSSKGVAEAPTSSAGAASAAVPAAAPATGGTVFPTTSVGGAARAPASADKTAASKAATATSGTVPSATPLRGAVGARESSAGAASSDAAAEAAPSTGDTTAPDASVERTAIKLTSAAGSSIKICGERRASNHLFGPGTLFPLEVRYYNSSWPKHGSNSNSSGNGSSSSSNDTTSNHDSWWEATCVGALLRPFDPGKRCRRRARRGKAVLGLDLPFDRGKAWRRMQHGG